jgi:acetyl esterase/lipase
MPSLQARLYSKLLRLLLKRRPTPDAMTNLAAARRRFTPPKWMRVPPPHGTLVREEAWGEIVSWQTEAAPRAVYFLHGGGYIFGNANTYRLFNAELAQRLSARVFAPNYRLAPEHPYPAALDDAVRGYLDLLAEMNRQAQRIVLVGDSAGGGLVVATLLKLRELNQPLPAAAIALSPWTDLACTGASLATNEKTDVMFYAANIRESAPHYHQAHSPTDPFISPLYAELKGLPPLQIFVSQSEALRDDSLRLADQARAHGVTTELHVYEGMPHVWPVFAFLPEAKAALAQMEKFVAAHAPLAATN